MNFRYARLIRVNAALMAAWRQAATLNEGLRALLAAEDDLFVSRAERGIRRFSSMGFICRVGPHDVTARALGSMVKEYCSGTVLPEDEGAFTEAIRTLTNIWAAAVGLPHSEAGHPGSKARA